jgi:hypothetical protein
VAHSLYTPIQAARSTLAAVKYLTVLPRTVRQDFSQEFVAGRGRTVDIPLPISIGPARNYTDANRTARAAIVFDDLSQATVPVTMGSQIYSAVRLPDDFATFTLTSLEQQVLIPQATVVAEGIVAPLITVMGNTAAASAGEAVTVQAADGSNALEVLIALRRVLNTRVVFGGRHVPQSDRYVAVGAEVEAAFLSVPLLQKVNESGDSDLLRKAIIKELFGFTILADPNLAPKVGIAYHSDAFVHVTRPSRQPQGAAFSAVVSQDGYALRWIQHYNPLQLEDQSVVDTFVGASTLVPEFAVKFGVA